MALSTGSLKKIRKEKSKWQYSSPEEYEKLEHELTQELMRNETPTISGSVRIIAGSAKNIKIDIPRKTRPVTDRMKTHLFDVLREDIANVSVLDLFAGSGSFGLEALSRGAKHATLVDAAKLAEKILIDNAGKTGLLSKTSIVKMKAADYVNSAISENALYELVFIDPPYKWFRNNQYYRVRDLIDLVKQVLPGYVDYENTKLFKGAIVMKHPAKFNLESIESERLSVLQTTTFGMNALSIFYVKPESEGKSNEESKIDDVEENDSGKSDEIKRKSK